jgi:hypothetical protein
VGWVIRNGSVAGEVEERLEKAERAIENWAVNAWDASVILTLEEVAMRHVLPLRLHFPSLFSTSETELN